MPARSVTTPRSPPQRCCMDLPSPRSTRRGASAALFEESRRAFVRSATIGVWRWPPSYAALLGWWTPTSTRRSQSSKRPLRDSTSSATRGLQPSLCATSRTSPWPAVTTTSGARAAPGDLRPASGRRDGPFERPDRCASRTSMPCRANSTKPTSWFEDAIAAAERQRYVPTLALAYNLRGIILRRRGRLDEAERWHRDALALYGDRGALRRVSASASRRSATSQSYAATTWAQSNTTLPVSTPPATLTTYGPQLWLSKVSRASRRCAVTMRVSAATLAPPRRCAKQPVGRSSKPKCRHRAGARTCRRPRGHGCGLRRRSHRPADRRLGRPCHRPRSNRDDSGLQASLQRASMSVSSFPIGSSPLGQEPHVDGPGSRTRHVASNCPLVIPSSPVGRRVVGPSRSSRPSSSGPRSPVATPTAAGCRIPTHRPPTTRLPATSRNGTATRPGSSSPTSNATAPRSMRT